MSDTLTNALAQAGRSSSVLSGIANPAVVNPLAGYGSAISAVQGIQELQEKAAQQAAGQAYQGAINQDTGEFDPNKFRTLLAQSPAAAMAAGPALANTQQISSDQLNQARAKAAWVNARAGAQLQSGDFSDTGMLRIFQDGIANGTLTMPEVQRQMAILPPDAAGRKQWLQEHQDTAASVQQQYDQRFGTTGSQTGPGGTTQGFVQQSPRAGGTISSAPQAGAPQGLSAEQLAAPHDYVDANGVTQHTTVGEYLKTLGISAQPGGRPVASPATTQPQSVVAQPTAGKTISGPQPGMAEKWKASADQYNADNAAAGSYQQRTFPLVQAASILKSGDVTTGQGSEAFNRVKSFLMTQATNLGLDAQTIGQADFDKVGKYLQQYVNQQGMSGRSDQALASAVSGNPSAHISTLANQQILPAMIGMERMRQMIITDFKAQGGQPNQYSDYAANWQNTHDPRAFVFDMLDQAQRKTMMGSLKTPAQRKAFSDTLDIVERNPGIMGQAVMPGQ